MRKLLRIPDYLEHIRDAIETIFKYVEGFSEAEFVASGLVQDAVIRNFEIMGEAARNIIRADPNFAKTHPKLPLGVAIGMRNSLSHGYFEVKLDLVWKTIKEDLPGFHASLLTALENRKAGGEASGDQS